MVLGYLSDKSDHIKDRDLYQRPVDPRWHTIPRLLSTHVDRTLRLGISKGGTLHCIILGTPYAGLIARSTPQHHTVSSHVPAL